jgi:CheY-like chemotaxis protein
MSNVVRLAARGQPRTILLVEPRAPSRIEIASYLRSRDYCVVEAVSGDETLRLLRSGRIAHLMLTGGDLQETEEGGCLVAAVAREFRTSGFCRERRGEEAQGPRTCADSSVRLATLFRAAHASLTDDAGWPHSGLLQFVAFLPASFSTTVSVRYRT